MSGHTDPCWTVEKQTSAAAAHVVITLGRPTSAEARDALLTRGVVATMSALVESAHVGRPVIVDVRPTGGTDPGIEAYLEAVRGLVQSFLLEVDKPVDPVNIVVTTADQDLERHRTVEYLSSADGKFSCGATYDLREGTS